MRARFLRSAMMLLAIAAGGCVEDTVAPDPIITPGPNEPIVYSKHIQPLLTQTCGTSGCHIGGSAEGGLALDSWEKVMAGSEHGGIVPYSSRKSHLFQHVNTDTSLGPKAQPLMPPAPRSPLTLDQIKTIKRWIDEGAKNDAGDVNLSGNRARVFVTNQGEDMVTALDIQTERVARYVSVGTRPDSSTPPEAPHNVTVSPDGRYFYVNMINAGSVEKYDAYTFQKLGAVQVGDSPAQIVVTSDGSTLYVSNYTSSVPNRAAIHKVNAANMTVTGTILEVGFAPHGVTLSADEKKLYTTNANGESISEIDLTMAEPEVVREFPITPGGSMVYKSTLSLKYEPYQGVLGPGGTTFWVTCRASNEVRVVDLVTGAILDSIPVGDNPLIPAMTPDMRELWVPNRTDDNVSIIDVATRKVVATIGDLDSQPHAVAFSADGKTAYVACENQNGGGHQHHATEGGKTPGFLYIIDVPSRQVREHLEVGNFAAGVAVGK